MLYWSHFIISLTGLSRVFKTSYLYSELFRDNFRDQIGVANLMTDAIWRLTGARYRATSESNAVGFISGTSGDYASGRDNIPLVYAIYTPRGPVNAWEIPESQINSIADEVFTGIVALASYIADLPLPGQS